MNTEAGSSALILEEAPYDNTFIDRRKLDSELRRLSLFHSFLYSRIALSLILITGYFLFAFLGTGTVIPVYLVLFLNLLPLALQFIRWNHVAAERTFLLSGLKRRYHYSSSSYRNQILTFSLTNCLLIIWQMYVSADGTFLALFPAAAFLVGVLARLCGFIITMLISRYRLMHGSI